MSGDDSSDEDICDVCQSGDASNPEDPIVFCDSCDVAVHQSCYHVQKVPSNEWYCYPCKIGFHPKNIQCALCKHSGGAFQRTNTTNGTWVHCLCANWIPELTETFDKKKNLGPVTCIDRLDKARERLTCISCKEKSGSLQCAYARCVAAVHPHCAIKKPSDFTWRVLECTTKEGSVAYHRELFCARHADAVGQPLKNAVVIQFNPNSRYTWGDYFVPILKEIYRHDPKNEPLMKRYNDAVKAAADTAKDAAKDAADSTVERSSLHHSQNGHKTSDSVKSSGDDASSSISHAIDANHKRKFNSSISGGRVPETGVAVDADCEAVPSDGRRIPMKRPRASIIQALEKAIENKAATSTSGGIHNPSVDKLGDRRAPYKAIGSTTDSNGEIGALSGTRAVTASISFVADGKEKAKYPEPPVSPSSLASEEGDEFFERYYGPSQISSTTPNSTPAPAKRSARRNVSERKSVGNGTKATSAEAGAKPRLTSVAALTSHVQESCSTAQVDKAALSKDGMFTLCLDADTVSALRSALLAAKPFNAVQQAQAEKLPSFSSEKHETLESVVRYRPTRVAGGVLSTQWTTLQKAGWLCLERMDSDDTIANTKEEIYFTPSTICNTSAVQTFSKSDYIENVQYFSSAESFRKHLTQNPCLLEDWNSTWFALKCHHGWRAITTDSPHSPIAPAEWALEEDVPVKCIYLSTLLSQRYQSNKQSQCMFLNDNINNNEDGYCADVGGSADGSASSSSNGTDAVVCLIEGIHKFSSVAAFQEYIHRFPYLLQDSATFMDTLVQFGWKRRIKRRSPQKHHLGCNQNANSDGEGESEEQMVGGVDLDADAGSGSSAHLHRNSEFLWEGAILPVSTTAAAAAPAQENPNGHWLGTRALRAQLWVEPHRLFYPYNQTLRALRYGGANVDSRGRAGWSSKEKVIVSSVKVSCDSGTLDDVAAASTDNRKDAAEILNIREELKIQLTKVKEKESALEKLAQDYKKVLALNAKLLHKEERRKEKKKSKTELNTSSMPDAL